MANRLRKQPDVTVIPGVPATPSRAAYCVTTSVRRKGHLFAVGQVERKVLPDGTTITTRIRLAGPWSTSHTITDTTTCYPAIVGSPGIPDKFIYNSADGWNAGARSRKGAPGDALFTIKVQDAALGTVVGLAAGDDSQLPSDATHALYVHDGQVSIMEHGQVVADLPAPAPYAGAYNLAIRRQRGLVTYIVGATEYPSANPSHGEVYLDVAIFGTDDWVDDPQILPFGNIVASLAPLDGFATNYLISGGRLPALQGVAYERYFNRISGALPAMIGRTADRLYAEVRGSLPRAQGFGYGGFPHARRPYVAGVLQGLSGTVRGLSGTIGMLSGVLPSFQGRMSDHALGEVRGQLQALDGVAYGTWQRRQYLILQDSMLADLVLQDTLRAALGLSCGMEAVLLISDAIYSTLLIDSQWQLQQAFAAVLRAGLGISTIAGNGASSLQYAVNSSTGALSMYEGFDFLAFANVGQDVYAARGDGVYRVRAGDDNGAELGVLVDFGRTDFGIAQDKTVNAINFGLDVEGQVFVLVSADGREFTYKVAPVGQLFRAEPGKGLTGRRWRFVLQALETSRFELDLVSIYAASSLKRRSR